MAKIERPGADGRGDDEPLSEAFADVAPRDIVLVTPNYTIDLRGVTLNVKPNRTISGASTLTVLCADPDLQLLNHPGLNPFGSGDLNAVAVVDRQVFSLAGMSLQAGRHLQLILEDDAVSALRTWDFPLTAKRGYFTRAQFIHSLCAEAGVPFVCPEIDDKQPIAKSKDALSSQTRRQKRAPGISKHAAAGLLMKGAPITEEQRSNLVAALDVARSVGASRSVVLAMLVYGIQESNWTYAVNMQNPSNPASGVFQLLATTQQSTGLDPHDVTACAHWFLTKGFGSAGSASSIAASSPDWSPGRIALYTGGGQGVYEASSYDRWLPEAQAIINAYTGGSTELTDTVTVDKPAQYRRKRGETSWDCMRRLADEVGWYLFVVNGAVHFHSPEYLRRSQPQMLVTPGADGIDEVTFDIDASPKFDDTISVTCRAKVWQAAPGATVDVVGYGPVDGRWIVQSIGRDSLASSKTKVVLQPPGKAKKEPAPDTKSKKVKGSTVAQINPEGGNDTNARVDRVYTEAQRIDKANLPYGPGGHGQAWAQARDASSLDCSSSTSLALHAGGMMDNVPGPQVSDWFLTWGAAGEGEHFTVWVHPGSGPNGHVWIEFHNRKATRFDTSPWGSGGSGPHLRYTPRSTEGFQPRHWAEPSAASQHPRT